MKGDVSASEVCVTAGLANVFRRLHLPAGSNLAHLWCPPFRADMHRWGAALANAAERR